VDVSELISVSLRHFNPVVFTFADTDHGAKAFLSVIESRNEDASASYWGIKYNPSTVWLALFIGLSEVRGPVKAIVFNYNSYYGVVGVWLTKF
jgi:hypothetical protein